MNFSGSSRVMAATAAALAAAGLLCAAEADIVIDYPSISPDGDGVKDSMTVTVELESGADTLALTVEDKSTRAVYDTLLFESPAGAGEWTAVWKGTDDSSSLLPEGAYDLRLYTGQGTAVYRTVIIDTSASLVVLDRIEPGIYSPGRPDTSAAVKIYFDVSGWEDGTEASLTVTGPEGVAARKAVPVTGDGPWSAPWKSASAKSGIYEASVSTLDEAGNSSEDSGVFLVDSDGPETEFLTSIPSNTREVPSVITGRAWDASGPPSIELAWAGHDEVISDSFAPDSTWTVADTVWFEFDTPDTVTGASYYSEGAYVLDAYAYDVFERESSAKLQFVLDRTPPSAPVIAPPPSRVIYEDLELSISFEDGVDSVIVYRAAGADTSRTAFPAAALGPQNPPTAVLAEGDNELFASVVDKAGNYSGCSASRTVELDISAGATYPEAFMEPGSFEVVLASEADDVKIDIFDMRGERVRRLYGYGPGRTFDIQWDLRDDDGDEVRNGAYLAVILVYKGSEKTLLEKNFVAVVR